MTKDSSFRTRPLQSSVSAGIGFGINSAYGAYVFRTIKLEERLGRTQHVSVKVFDGDDELLKTRSY